MKKKQQRKQRQFEVCAGRKAVMELLLHCPGAVGTLYLAENSQVSSDLRDVIDNSGVPVQNLSFDEIEGMAEGARHQGVLAALLPRHGVSLEDFLRSAPEDRRLVLVLDQISDPHNVGAILRCAEAAGVSGVIVSKNNSAPISATVRKVSCGASEILPIIKVANIARCLEELKKSAYWIAGTALGEGSRSLYEDSLPMPLAIVLGSEERGIRELTKRHCDLLLQVPMRGKMQSLNVAQSAAVILFELLRQDLSGGAGI